MSAASEHLEDALLDHVFGGPDFNRPANLYLALFTTAVGDDGSGTEATGTNYARVLVANSNVNFPGAANGVKSNGIDIVWPTAGGSWGTVTHVAIFDAASGGNLITHSALDASKAIANGDTYRLPIGALDITLV